MKLRNHPKISYKGFPSWPPMWVRLDDPSKQSVEGDEAGVLTEVKIHDLASGRIALSMQEGSKEYLAHLLIEDNELFLRVYKLLQKCIWNTIKEIGDVDIE